jgi:alcohol dehydrogenase/L-iditol 2-dehydrogenase
MTGRTDFPITMRALVQHAPDPRALEMRNVAVRRPRMGEVLVKVRATAICGSDVQRFNGTDSWTVRTPVIIGHEFSGEIWAAGDGVADWHEGDRVVCETAARACGSCEYCRSGRPSLCPDRAGFGQEADGACAEFIAVPSALLHLLPPAISWQEGAATEPCCVAASACIEQSIVRPGDTVVIFGPGSIGLLCTQLVMARGASNVIVVGLPVDEARLKLAYGFGATQTVAGGSGRLPSIFDEIGDGRGPSLVVEASGSPVALEQALRIVRPGGQITRIGMSGSAAQVNLDLLVRKAVTLRGSFGYSFDTWERVLRLMAAGMLNGRPLLREYDFADWRAAFAAMQHHEAVKAVLLL